MDSSKAREFKTLLQDFSTSNDRSIKNPALRKIMSAEYKDQFNSEFFAALPHGKAYKALYDKLDETMKLMMDTNSIVKTLSSVGSAGKKLQAHFKVMMGGVEEFERMHQADSTSDAVKIKMTKIVREDSKQLMDLRKEYKAGLAACPDIKPLLARYKRLDDEFKQLPHPTGSGEEILYMVLRPDVLREQVDFLVEVTETVPKSFDRTIEDCKTLVKHVVNLANRNAPKSTDDKQVVMHAASPTKASTGGITAALSITVKSEFKALPGMVPTASNTPDVSPALTKRVLDDSKSAAATPSYSATQHARFSADSLAKHAADAKRQEQEKMAAATATAEVNQKQGSAASPTLRPTGCCSVG